MAVFGGPIFALAGSPFAVGVLLNVGQVASSLRRLSVVAAVLDVAAEGAGVAGLVSSPRGLGKFLRNNPPGGMDYIRIVGDGYDITYP
ncbi:hypothetical protein ABZ439_17365 [Streptomyces sp. NPDC005840]|uniref:hypothetical protein n=1 Tax=Streptomyces sp. NPDC005840 TaxID=3157072 RepID=UPI003401E88F